jgi:glycine/D-amino acid oxidase-like deaminating enzyme
MVQLSLRRWCDLQTTTKRTLYTPTGLLTLGTEDDNFTQPSYSVLRKLGLPTERLTEQHCRQRFPQFTTHAYDTLTYNAEAGILHASKCLQTLKELIIDLGGSIHEDCRVISLASDSPLRPVRLYLHSGRELTADRVVIAIGPWVHRLLSHLRLPVQLTRQYLLYFAGLPTSMFGANKFPAFFAHDLYGFPILNSGYASDWLKATSHNFGTRVDPDEVSLPDERVVARIAMRLRELLPALQQAELAHVDSCMYDVTPDEDFILDALPYDFRVVFATGLTGHGFKFGLLLGELLSSMVRETQPIVSLERFRLRRFSHREVCQTSSVA